MLSLQVIQLDGFPYFIYLSTGFVQVQGGIQKFNVCLYSLFSWCNEAIVQSKPKHTDGVSYQRGGLQLQYAQIPVQMPQQHSCWRLASAIETHQIIPWDPGGETYY
jgi:hypothetical protein